MFTWVNVDGFINSSVHRKIGLLITIQVQRRNMDATLNRSLPNRCPDDFATHRDFAWQSRVHGNQLHVTMTRRTEFTASIQSEIRFGEMPQIRAATEVSPLR